MASVMKLEASSFMSVHQVAEYLQLNEKKIYALVNEGKIPATKVTGKWMFPRELIDQWMLDGTHGGLLNDRLIIGGSDDPLLYRIILEFSQDSGAHALISYNPTGTRLGLELLQARRIDACGMHWGPSQESHTRHPALLRQYPHHRNWVLIRFFLREQGLLVKPELGKDKNGPEDLFDQKYRWALRQTGAGSQRFLMEILGKEGLNLSLLNSDVTTLSEREAAAAVAMGKADVAPGARAAASEAGLGFISMGWESFDLALPKDIWFRRLFQDLIQRIKSPACHRYADELGGYDFVSTGELVWGQD
jgi:excisionase family DNA binding protein